MLGVIFALFFAVPSYAASSITDPLPTSFPTKTGAVWDENNSTSQNGSIVYNDGTSTGEKILNSNTQITFKNSAGYALPSTGGNGTTIFVLVGTILVCFAGVCLIFRQRCVANGESSQGRNAGRDNIFHFFSAFLIVGIMSTIGVCSVLADEGRTSSTTYLQDYQHGDLMITVEGTSEQYFPVSVSLSNVAEPEGTTAKESYTISGGDYSSNPTSVSITNGSGNVTVYIKNGQTITIQDLPTGTEYSAVETDNNGFSTKYKVEATKVETVTLTITPYLDVSSYQATWTKDQQKLHDSYTYQIPRGATISLSSYGLNDPDLRFYHWINSTLWTSSSGNSNRDASVTMSQDYSIEEWYRADFGYYMITYDYGYWADADRNEVTEDSENGKYRYGFIQFGLADDATAEMDSGIGITSPTRTGYTFGGWYTEKDGKGTKITSILDGTISTDNYSSAVEYMTALNSRRTTLYNNFISVTTNTTQAEKDGLDAYIALLRTKHTVSYDRASSYVAEKTLYAYWIKVTSFNDTLRHRVTNTNYGASSGSTFNFVVDTTSLANTAVGTTLTMDSATRRVELNGYEVYEFNSGSDYTSNWAYTDGTGEDKSSGTFTQPEAAVTINCYYRPTTYTITYNLDGGTVGSGSSTSYTVLTGYTITDPTKDGYDFAGWTDAEGNDFTETSVSYDNTGLTAANIVSTMADRKTGNLELTAKWTRGNTYAVKFDANGGSGAMDEQTMTYGTSANLTANSFTRSGYAFMGWSTDNTATTATYKDGASVTDLVSTEETSVTLYAVWAEAVEIRIRGRYRPNGIDTGTNQTTFYNGDSSNYIILNIPKGTYTLNEDFFTTWTGTTIPDGYVFGGIVSQTIYSDSHLHKETSKEVDISSWTGTGYIDFYFAPSSSGAKGSVTFDPNWDD